MNRPSALKVSIPGVEEQLTFSPDASPITVGRDGRSAIQLQDPSVCQHHARIRLRDTTWLIEDLGSRNGIRVNGELVRSGVLGQGAKILIGDVYLTVQMQSVEALHDEDDFSTESSEGFGDVSATSASIPQAASVVDLTLDVLSQHSAVDALESLAGSLRSLDSRIASVLLLHNAGRVSGIKPVAWTRFGLPGRPLTHAEAAVASLSSGKPASRVTRGTNAVFDANSGWVVIPCQVAGQVNHLLQIELSLGANAAAPSLGPAIDALVRLAAPHLEVLHMRAAGAEQLRRIARSLGAIISAKDTYTAGHSERVATFSHALAKAMRLDRETTTSLVVSAACHDIGKIGVAEAVLRKPGMLSADEFEEMKAHPAIGYEIALPLPKAEVFISGIRHHHERFDGTGYPDGLEGEKIPFFARVVAVADAFDAMISGRPYSGFMGEEEAVRQLCGKTDIFDPDILQALDQAWSDGALVRGSSTNLNRSAV